ncbi:MAG TPA: PEP-CTERM sorting domain-containing protein [Verrucomicrobiae bacterium]|nr:PEP-CTERM sorting domain-containing protein [Verrucomicrobiae bacterium]
MKKSFVTILALCGMIASVHAQGAFVIDSSINIGSNPGPLATNDGLVYITPDGNPAHSVLDTTQDINLAVLWGTSAGNVTTPLNIDPLGLNTGIYAGTGNWYASQPTGHLDITGYASGALLDVNGNQYFPPGQAAGTKIWLVLEGWTGNTPSPFDAPLFGETAPFSITLAANFSPFQPDVHTMGSLNLTIDPEPSVPALTALAGVAFALFRRRK